MKIYKNILHTFGFNAFNQLCQKPGIKITYCHDNIERILLANWEITIIVTEQNEILVWGYQADKIKYSIKRWNKDKIGLKLKKMFGYNDHGIGILDINGRLWWYSFLKESYILLAKNIKRVDICQNLQSVFLLSEKGIVTTYQLSDNNNNYKYKNQFTLKLPKVFDMAISVNHVLFAVEGSPCIYALGNNHYSQLGLDPYQFRFLHPHQPQPIDFFNGLCYLNETNHHIVSVSCGPFHSAVIINQDLYTFGWKQKGLLAWEEEEEEGEEESGLIQLACFKTVNGQSIEVPINKVVCGSTHTVAIDDNKNVWICGQNKYFQLGMNDEMKVAFQFEKCPQIRNAIDCATAPWSTLIIENTKNC